MEDAPKSIARKSLFGTHAGDIESSTKIKDFVLDKFSALKAQQPAFDQKVTGMAMDDSSNGYPSFKMYDAGNNSVSDAVVYWYASQGFIGAQLCGILAQNWLVNKACAMPGDDAIRKGYNVVSIDGDELDPDAVKIIKAYDRSMRLTWNMREFIRKGRIFGIRVAMFKVQSTDPEYYEKPFNIDGVTANSYKGIVQVDPYWCAPMLDGAAASQPDTLHFYEPTWWIINGKKVHRSHLIIFRHAEPVDVLKPQYIYGGVPLTQQIMERVYASERVANEAPQLAMSKRTTVWLTDMEVAMSNTEQSIRRLNYWAQMRDNYGIKLGDKEGDEFQQFDTSLADFDSLIMTQYQLVAAIAGVPATKLIGTTPKGFNSTGEYEEASYHELLESIQTHDLTPLAERHHQLVIKSFVEPQLKIKMNLETTLNWLPLDSPTAEELAATNYSKAQTGAVLINSGVVSSEEERQRVATDKTSGYNEIGLEQNEAPQAEEQAEEDYLSQQDAMDAEHWITLNGKKKGEKEGGPGSHVLINGEGEVVGGAGGNLNGKTLSNVKSKSKEVGGKTEGGKTEPTKTEPTKTETLKTETPKIEPTKAETTKTKAPKENKTSKSEKSKSESSFSNSDEITKHFTEKFGLGFQNGVDKKKNKMEAVEKFHEFQKYQAEGNTEKAEAARKEYWQLRNSSNSALFNQQFNVNSNTPTAKKFKKVLVAVDNALSDLTSAGFDIKSALNDAKVSIGASPAKRGTNGTAWQHGDHGIFSIKLRDEAEIKEQKARSEQRKAAGKPRWSISSEEENPMRATIVHEMAHALGMQKHINSPAKLAKLFKDLQTNGKIGESSSVYDWVKHNISEYAASNIKEADAELAAMLMSYLERLNNVNHT